MEIKDNHPLLLEKSNLHRSLYFMLKQKIMKIFVRLFSFMSLISKEVRK